MSVATKIDGHQFSGFWYLLERRPSGRVTLFQSKPNRRGVRLEIHFGVEMGRNHARQLCKRLNDAGDARAFWLAVGQAGARAGGPARLSLVFPEGGEGVSMEEFLRGDWR